jgi:two-component system, OmpR family, sensor kinase
VRLARRVSLRTRLAALAAVGAMIVLSIGALLLYRDISGKLSGAITDELTIRLDDLAANVEEGVMPSEPGFVTQVVGRDGDVLSPTGAAPVLTAAEFAAASRGEIIVDREVPGIGEHARLLARPIDGPGAEEVVGVVATSTAALAQARERLTIVLAVAGPVLAAAVGAAAWVVTGAALRPVRQMTNEAATISMAEPGPRLVQPSGDDEIAELGRTLNAMLARIESTVAHERAFIDDAAHELRSPIAVLRGELELAAQDPGDADAVARSLASALEETDRLTHLTEDLLTLARADAGQLASTDATTDLLAVARAGVDRLPQRDDVSIEVAGEPVLVRGDASWISQIVTNLVANADRHAGSRILVSTTRSSGHGRLTVADDGAGFPPELLPRAFDRFSRSDGARSRTRGGTGLGLAIVASLAHALHGTVSATNGPPFGGACIQVELPLAA